MNQRLSQFLAAENITQAQFADTIEVAKASVSHVISGRNNPGYDFIRSVALHYPHLNVEWLITGKGKMYSNGTSATPQPQTALPSKADEDDLFSSTILDEPVMPSVRPVVNRSIEMEKPTRTMQREQVPPSANKRIEKIMVFYSDGTYSEMK